MSFVVLAAMENKAIATGKSSLCKLHIIKANGVILGIIFRNMKQVH